ncbi:protein FAM136A [Petromyzon marinus]|uniref:Protein FAM136A n=2 Tax=Petromyzon marinus TaxID=7757 RepID=A0AAJ7SVX2_PETMA|nr:protein FAM136A [Petromyzon marinus]
MDGVEAAQTKVQDAVNGMVDKLEREHIRKMQARMFRCSAECCENSAASMSAVHHCIERCHAPLVQAQSIVTNELERFQNRLQRCAMSCSDKAKDSFDSGTKEQVVKQQLESCVRACADEHQDLIPNATRRLHDTLSSLPQ